MAKGCMDPTETKELFSKINNAGSVFLQDLYVFLKKKGMILNKKDLKFIHRYFKFNQAGSLNLEEFRLIFMQPRKPQHFRLDNFEDS